MQAEPMASVAVLTPNPVASDVYFEGLTRAELPRLRRIRDGEFPFKARCRCHQFPGFGGFGERVTRNAAQILAIHQLFERIRVADIIGKISIDRSSHLVEILQ